MEEEKPQSENAKRFLGLVHKDGSGWLEKAMQRQENEYWTDISFGIAVKILSVIRKNKAENLEFPKSQEELANKMEISEGEMRKMLRGQHNFDIQTIGRLQIILNAKLI